ncbi:MAG: urea transporter [Cyanobacteriota bacterium]|nr:urea transporter [Cyanobacteriota bacterium]
MDTGLDSAFDLLKGVLKPPVSLPTRLQRLLPTSGTLHGLHAPARRLHPGLLSLLGGLRGLAQVIFINNPLSGLVLLLAFLAQSPWTALLALLGISAAHATARQLDLQPGLRREGIYGFNGALVGCAVAAIAHLEHPLAVVAWGGLVLLGGALSTLVLEGLRRSLHPALGLPPLTLPFCLISWILLAVGSFGPGSALALAEPVAPPVLDGAWQALAQGLPRSLGQVFLCSKLGSGLLVLLSVALASPLAAGLALLGALVGMGTGLLLGAPIEAIAQGLWGYNGVLVAIALGGIFYAPSLGSLAVALGGAALATLLQSAWSVSALQGWPSFTLAFVLATWVVQLVVRRALPALIPVSLHAIVTPEEHRQRFVLARTLLSDFRRNLHLAHHGQRRALLAGRVPALTRQRISVLFDRLDRDGDGAISTAELLKGLQLNPRSASDTGVLACQLTEVLTAMDLDGNGRVDAEEFAELMLRLQRLQLGEERLLTYLLPVDGNGNDRLDPIELRRLFTSVGVRPLLAEEEDALFARSPQGLTWRQFVDRLLLT